MTAAAHVLGRSLQVLVLVGTPAALLWLQHRVRLVAVLGPVLFCYGVGIAYGNQPLCPASTAWSMSASGGAIALAIPLLLFSVDVRAWFRLASSTLLSFAAVVVAVLAAATLGYALFRHTIPHSREIAAMLVGVYTGGTPNLAAIGTGLGVSSDTLVAVNAADVVVGGAYLLFLFTVAPRVYGWVLRPLRRPHGSAAAPSDLPAAPGAAPGSTAEPLPAPALETAPGDATTAASWETERPTWRSGSLALASAVGVLGGSVALAWLLPIRPFEVSAVLAVTTLSVAASLVPAIHRLRGSYALGQYLLLVFCVAVGSTARFDRFTAASLLVVGMLTFVMVGAALLHLGLAWVLRIDRDTALITSTAGIYGPAFVGPVAVALGNDRQVLFSGLACGLLGYAVGNYLGLGLAWVLG